MHTCGTTTAINGALEPFCDALCCCCETHNGTLSVTPARHGALTTGLLLQGDTL